MMRTISDVAIANYGNKKKLSKQRQFLFILCVIRTWWILKCFFLLMIV